jgi:hypothetical protein
MMSRPGETSYEIARASGTCAASGRALEAGESYIAALVEREGEEGLRRVDFSLEAWERGEHPRPPLVLFGFWRARFDPQDEGRRRQPLIDDDSLVELLEQLEGVEESSRVSFRYILALLLVRKKVLRLETVERGGERPVMLLRRAGQSEGQATPWRVVDPGMNEEQIAAAVEQLGAVMSE